MAKKIEVKKEITLALTGFVVRGTAKIACWGGGEGFIEMNSTYLSVLDVPTKKEVANHINDGEFGCECIISAVANVNALYNGGYEVEDVVTYHYKKEEIPRTAKRGI